MKSVVMITYWFPPEGCAGVYRPLRFIRHLPDLGWSPQVVTVERDPLNCERYDPGLLSSVPSSVNVVRVGGRDPWQSLESWRARCNAKEPAGNSLETTASVDPGSNGGIRSLLRRLVRKAEASCYHPDDAMGWIRPAVRKTLELCAGHRPEALWATAGPVSSFVVAERVSRESGVPYVLDFRDSWTITYNEFEDNRPTWARSLDRKRMYRLLKKAQAVVFRFGSEAECYWRLYQDALQKSQIHLIPNGYDGPVEPFAAERSERCQFLYTGTVSDYRYDTLLQALRIFKERSPDQAKKISFHFVGEGSDALGKKSQALGINDLVVTQGPVTHGEIMRLTRAAHALLILGRPRTMRGHELFAGAKLFGYLQAGRPILGVLPGDETRKILQRIGVCTIADADSMAEILAVIEKLLHSWSNNQLADLLPDPIACMQYSAEHQTAALARALEGKPAIETFVPGSNEIPLSLRCELAGRLSERGSWGRILSPAK